MRIAPSASAYAPNARASVTTVTCGHAGVTAPKTAAMPRAPSSQTVFLFSVASSPPFRLSAPTASLP
ncbi:hypothetical protein GCM10009787_28850 [Streptomyces bangladeshensis]|uniref:Uncharacterized protein n=1 Tax=Streptomyces bangladeshensis TaxID=295352 RepID=A0ABN3BGR3_9ACTN